jgi:predicted transcriptional regulator YdeE
MPEIKVKSHPQMTVIGLLYHGKNEGGEISQLWEKLMERQGDIKDIDGSVMACYGVSIMGPDFDETMVFDYIAGYPVTKAADELPKGMGKFTIPEGQFAVITCPNLASISQAYCAIYRFVRESEEVTFDFSGGNFNFELYGEEFNLQAGSEKFYIFVPIKEK